MDTNKDKGVLILEKFGNFGVLTLLKKVLSENFSQKYPEFIIDIFPLIPKGLFKKYLGDGNLRKLTFITHKIPTDLSKVYRDKGYEEKVREVKIEIVAKRFNYLPKPKWIRDVIEDKRTISELVEIKNDFKTVKVEVDIKGNRRTLNFSNEDQLNPYFEITDRVKLAQGHPTYESIDKEAIKLLNEIKEEMLL